MRQTFIRTLSLLVVLVTLMSTNAFAQFFSKKSNELLSGDEAFQVSAEIVNDRLTLFWIIEPDYYMYRDQFLLEPVTANTVFGEIDFPEGVVENDPEFGEVVVYFNSVELSAPILSFPKSGDQLEFTIRGQGCNKPVGVCYPPQSRTITVDFEPTEATGIEDAASPAFSTNSSPQERSIWSYVTAAFLAGVLLSFTPCVLPMIPILLGVIAGQKGPSKLRSGWLATCYVAGTIVVYAIAGWVAGRTGAQLQAYFQNPWFLAVICLLLILLAVSLFGVFKIQLPSSIQTKLNDTSLDSKSASFTSFTLGLISSLVVGACVSPILIVTLTAALSQGDPLLGSAVMAAMALGMGLLLIALGFGAGWLLPKAGAWMNHVQVLFGFWVLGAAIYISGFNDNVPVLYLWSILLLWNGLYLWQIGTDTGSAVAKSLILTLSTSLMLWGTFALFGAATGSKDILNPLKNLVTSSPVAQQNDKLPFVTVTKLADTTKLLDNAKQTSKPTLVDFYADWCLDCKRMARTTFREPAVHTALDGWQLIEVDVTETNSDSEELKQFFDVFGPPATLFVNSDGVEHADLRQYGYLSKEKFLEIIDSANSKN